MNGTNVLTAMVEWSRTPIAQALWDTAKYGAPKLVEAVKQQSAVTPADIAETTKDFASASELPAEGLPEPTLTVEEPSDAGQAPEVQ